LEDAIKQQAFSSQQFELPAPPLILALAYSGASSGPCPQAYWARAFEWVQVEEELGAYPCSDFGLVVLFFQNSSLQGESCFFTSNLIFHHLILRS
jgi:hypothetical protein